MPEASRLASELARLSHLTRWDRAVDPDNQLDPEERARRAAAAKADHFRQMGIRSGEARRARSARKDEAA